ncbi:hypothetical protein H7Y40_01085 [Pedobacter sp.]|nr:hypothetical protein [Candidatus Saccharibacteria bacterium]
MYSGITLRNSSGNVMGAHQKIDRVARKHLSLSLPETINFPTAREILMFEGKNGADGIKSKSPARDEPWHYIDPTDASDRSLIILIEDHLANLTNALVSDNRERAAFEAAWLAHAIVDGLTPAHHYPLQEKLEELRGGEGLETRTTYRKKIVMPGTGPRQRLRNNWEFWGAKGVMTTHVLFEIGVASTIASQSFDSARPSGNDRVRVENDGFTQLYLEALANIHHLGMYEVFQTKGWTRDLARQTKHDLAPVIIRMVTLAWHVAALKAADKKDRITV